MVRELYARTRHSSLILSAHLQQGAARTACATSTMGFPVRDRVSRSGIESRVEVEISVKKNRNSVNLHGPAGSLRITSM
ncbi:hypothetical protein SCLCIDRAFT_1209503 [Scleroderma citrinum Foug A]|uniref:Uncharacterized protein n=1 Tax=Scleroderma citrinum Foug A TaxID=1036808 RepID=A0A0C3E5S6_9AGAM|nr:hypothetical protein SCLCIDRAFT_1209503 [Scleroderma citrinum Foug A]